MTSDNDLLRNLAADLPRTPKRPRQQSVKTYCGVGLKTYTDRLGNEVPLPLSPKIIHSAPALLRDVAELWRSQGLNVMAQQFTAAHAVIGAVLDGCCVRAQENTYMLNLQVMVVGGAGAGKSRVALLDRLVEPIDRELRLAHRRRMDDYRRELLRHTVALQEWKKNGGRGDPPLPPDEPLPRSLLLADATTQAALVRWLAGNDGHPSLMRHDELTTLVGALQSKYGNFGDILKKAFDNGKHEKQLRTDDEGYYIRRVGLATVFSTTPGVLRTFIGSYEDGLASRIVGHFTASEPTFDGDPSPEAMAAFNARMEALAERVEELWRAVTNWQTSDEGQHVNESTGQQEVLDWQTTDLQTNRLADDSAASEPFPKHSSASLQSDSLKSRKMSKRLLLCLSADQQARFVRHFKYLMKFYVALDDLGEEAVPIIRRRAVDTRRILMIWSLCRRTEELYRDSAGHICFPADGLIRPTDDDLRAVLDYANYLVCQSVFMHRLVAGAAHEEKADDRPVRRSPLEHLSLLPETFTREEADSAARLCGVTPRTTRQRITRWIGQGFVHAVGDGVYKKLRVKS